MLITGIFTGLESAPALYGMTHAQFHINLTNQGQKKYTVEKKGNSLSARSVQSTTVFLFTAE